MNLAPLLKQREFDTNGVPLVGGKLYSYAAGTTTPQATYTDQGGGTPNANPVVLDSSGRGDVWIPSNVAYKFVLKDSAGNTLWTVDNVRSQISGIAWDTNESYSSGDVVQDANGILYVSLADSNQGNAVTNVASWRAYGGNIRALTTSTALAVTDDFIRSNSTSGALTMTLPACSTTAIGKRIRIKDVGTGGYTTAVKGAGSDNVDGANTWVYPLSLNQAAEFENNGTSWDVFTQGPLFNRVTGTTVGVGGVAISSSSGGFQIFDATFVDVTNLAVTITTTGRPVSIALQGDGSSNLSQIQIQLSGSGGAAGLVKIFRGVTLLTKQTAIGVESDSSGHWGDVAPGCVKFIDTPAAGTYTYKIQGACSVSSPQDSTMVFQYVKLVVYEL